MSEYDCIDTGEGFYRCFNAYPTVYPEEVTTGLRDDPLRSCQYWVKGMVNICSYWNITENRCTYRDSYTHIPSGWNAEKCDFLGRRGTCDRYNSAEEQNTDQYICIAPNAFISGLYKPVASGILLRPIDKSEVYGYNEEDGEGRCDGLGRGTATDGTSVPVEDVDDRAIVCNYYRPWQMGFGSLKPHPIDITYKDRQRIITQEAIDEAYELVGQPLERQLPFDFKIFNFRGKIQKCIHWDEDYGSDFALQTEYNIVSVVEHGGDVSDINDHVLYNDSLSGPNVSPCQCTDSEARPFTTVDFSQGQPSYMMLALVWSHDAGTIVCNGAKPECPCYTGQWKYCIDDKMGVGQRITANQMLELRFWAHDWETQSDYEKYWESIPGTNPNDPTSADIYTFTLWRTDTSSNTPMESIMEGRRISICMPANILDKRFTSDYFVVESVVYPRATIDTGTAPPNAQSFPTLIRDLSNEYELNFQVIYPYVGSESPFDRAPCDEYIPGVFVKKSCDIDGDSITVVGGTIRNRQVYVLMPGLYNLISDLIDQYNSMALVPEDLREGLYTVLQSAVNTYLMERPEDIYSTTSDEESGFFMVGPVDLTYQSLNSLLVLVDYGDGTWDFKKRVVWSQFYGGLIVQKTFSHTYGDGNYIDVQPEFFSPDASLTGNIKTFAGDNGLGYSMATDDLFSVYSISVESLLSIDEYYTYCKKLVTKQDVLVENWGQIPGTSMVWLEVDDIDLNYLMEWEITESKMVSSDSESDLEVEMILFYPTSITEQNTILPNTCILKPSDDVFRGFFRDDYDLIISYEYEKIDTTDELEDDESISFPSGGFSTVGGVNRSFISPPFDIELTEDAFLISNLGIKRGSVALMATFVDETGRLVSATATKLCTMVTTNRCRSVAIKYGYKAIGSAFALNPSGFTTFLDNDIRTGGTREHSSFPPCGDHLMTKYSQRGPMWYPYNACSNSDFYNVVNPANFCANPKGQVGTAGVDYTYGRAGVIYRDDHRMSCPATYTAWVGIGGRWAAACGAPWKYYYSYVDSIESTIFSGYVKKRKSVDPAWYLFNDWELPPFGNVDREYMEKWISQDYISYNVMNSDGSSVATEYEYVPMVIDNMTMYMSFNAFDRDSLDPEMDCFSSINQMNFVLSNTIGEALETVSDEDPTYLRYRFDEVFEVKHHAHCVYPKPVYILGNGGTSVAYYLFKNDDHTWAWPERWKDVERQSDADRLAFVHYERPEYKYDYFKGEFRYICDEDTYIIKYTKPVLEEGNFTTYPSISIDGAPERYFEILYSSYGDTQVTWKDEGNGVVDGSGSEDGNIYELTSGDNWNHDPDIIFDSEAVDNEAEASDVDRSMIEDYDDLQTPPEQTKYFNRGLIASIKRNRLKYLPYEETELTLEFESNLPEEEESYGNSEHLWYDVSPILSYEIDSTCISKIVITGEMGFFDEDDQENALIACKPGVVVRSRDWPSEILFSSVYEEGPSDDLSDYEIIIELEINPDSMVRYRLEELKIEFTCYDDQYISVNSPIITEANYIDKEETITIYERKYIVSNASLLGDVNLNGVGTPLTFKQTSGAGANFGGAGVYFPGHYTGISYHDSLNAIDKLRVVCSSEAYENDEIVPTTFSTLKDIERESQGDLYEYAYNLDTHGDNFIYTLVMPPVLFNFLTDVVANSSLNGSSSINAQKLPWENHNLKANYVEYDFWRGGGHKYEWSPDYFTTRCLLFGPVERVYDATFLHIDSGRGFSPTDVQSVWKNKEAYAATWHAYQGY